MRRLRTFVIAALVAALVSPAGARAEATRSPSVAAGGGASSSPGGSGSSLDWEAGEGRSYLIPATELLGYLFLLNQVDRNLADNERTYRTNGDTIWQHLKDQNWKIDDDGFSINQFAHPYGGSVYYGLPRSTGLGFWESSLYSAVGSFFWEMAGERSDPSINDQIFTPIGGTVLGESFFRMASLLLESGGDRPGWARELGAAVVSPPLGFNRFTFGDRFDAVYPSHQPATFARLQIGAAFSHSSHNVSSHVADYTAIGSFALDYGLPGKPGYGYERPFDYFEFELNLTNQHAVDALLARGLLFGRGYAAGESTRGVWGLYASYDYASPQVFRVSSVAVSLGTTWQTWLGRSVAVQGTVLGGGGYAGAGTFHRPGNRDYHYGFTPEGLTDLRLIFGDRAMLDVTGREYYVSDFAAPAPDGWENMVHGDASLTLRIWGRHGVGLHYSFAHRDARYPGVAFRNESVGTLSLVYVLLGQEGFGAVEWR